MWGGRGAQRHPLGLAKIFADLAQARVGTSGSRSAALQRPDVEGLAAAVEKAHLPILAFMPKKGGITKRRYVIERCLLDLAEGATLGARVSASSPRSAALCSLRSMRSYFSFDQHRSCAERHASAGMQADDDLADVGIALGGGAQVRGNGDAALPGPPPGAQIPSKSSLSGPRPIPHLGTSLPVSRNHAPAAGPGASHDRWKRNVPPLTSLFYQQTAR